MFDSECIAELNGELRSVEELEHGITHYAEAAAGLEELCLSDQRKAAAEMSVLCQKVPSLVESLRSVKGVLSEFVCVSEEVCEAQTFKTRLEVIESQMSRLKLMESCLLVALDFDTNIQGFEDLYKSLRHGGGGGSDTAAELAHALRAKEPLLKWWSDCESNSEIVEAFGQWRFNKFTKIKTEVRKIIQQCVKKEIHRILETSFETDAPASNTEPVKQLLTLCVTNSVLCRDLKDTVSTILLSWWHDQHRPGAFTIPEDERHLKRLVEVVTDKLVPSDSDVVTEFFNALVAAEIKARKFDDVQKIQEILALRIPSPSPRKGSVFRNDDVIIDWGASALQPSSVQLTQKFVKDLYKYNLNQILQKLPITVKSTMQVLTRSSSDVASVIHIIKDLFVSNLPEVLSRIQHLFNTFPPHLMDCNDSAWITIVQNDLAQALIQNLYHPLTTSFTNPKLTLAPFLRLVDFVETDVLCAICQLITRIYRGATSPDPNNAAVPATTGNLNAIRSLVISNTLESVREGYSELVEDYAKYIEVDVTAQQCPSILPSPQVQKIATSTLDLLGLFFADASDQASEIETDLLPNMLASLLEIYLDRIGQLNISESLNRCFVTASDIIALLKFANSLINPESTKNADQQVRKRLSKNYTDLRSIAHACVDALGSEPRAKSLEESLAHLPISS